MTRAIQFLRRRLFAIIVVAVCSTAVFLPLASQSTLAPAHKIDLLTQSKGGGFKGDDVRNRTGNGQISVIRNWKGGKADFRIRLQNEGEVPDTFKMRGPNGNRDFRVRYFHKGKNFTSRFKSGSMITPEVPSMDVLNPDFLVKIKLGRNVRKGKTKIIRVKGQSVGAPVGDGTDVVKAKLRAP